MDASSEAPPADAAASLAKLPALRVAAAGISPGIRKYWPAATIGGLCIIIGIGVLWWSVSGKSPMN